ncbi:Protein of unknown function [Vreelandella subterranea]|uniref:Uncharacterized protein n=1 Tax=Vreelandella subterranea TaxID=416874 RepID=A0A1H9S147_9GAMM|nr:DUF2635 domain-containing protein [Halomonas subterranea]SER78776.1 Protein of unknown function [Halomonas subterranea]
MPSIYVKPRLRDAKKPDQGVLLVRRESNGKPITEKGAHVELTPYIRRRLRDGDLVKANAPAKPSRAKAAAKSTASAADAGEQEA